MSLSTGDKLIFDFPEFDEGYSAYVHGLKNTSCPYDTDSARYNIWQLGYEEAWLDAKLS